MKDLLGVTGEGLGGAAESRWRPDRVLSKRAVNLIGTAAGAAGVVLLALNLLIPSKSANPGVAWADVQPSPVASSAPVGAVAPLTSANEAPNGALAQALQPSLVPPGLRSYALELTRLSGLPPDIAPGTPIELWAAWDSDEGMPGFQKVINNAVVERVAAPVVEGSPPVVLLQISKRDLRDLLWADRYGTLAAVLLSQSSQPSYPQPSIP